MEVPSERVEAHCINRSQKKDSEELLILTVTLTLTDSDFCPVLELPVLLAFAGATSLQSLGKMLQLICFTVNHLHLY